MHLTREDYKKLLIPTKREVFTILLLVVITFLVFEINLIVLKLTQNTIFAQSDVQESFINQIRAFFENNKIANILTLVAFWGSLGLIVYSVVWSIYSLVSEAKNEIEVDNDYINQLSKKEKNDRRVMQLGIVAGVVVLGIFSLWLSAPLAINMWSTGISQIPEFILSGSLQVLLGLILISINFYCFKILIDWLLILE